MAITVYCLASDRPRAVALVDALRTAGLRGSDVSIVYPHLRQASGAERPSSTPARAAERTRTAPGGELDAAVGWLMGTGSVAIPGFGLLIAAGPILAVLSGTGNATASDGFAGSLIGHGIPAAIARRLEFQVRAGQVMISVHAMDGPDVDTVVRLLKLHGADHIHAAPDALPAMSVGAIPGDQGRAEASHATSPVGTGAGTHPA